MFFHLQKLQFQLSAAIFCVAVALQAFSAFHMGGFWLDEADSVSVALRSFSELWGSLKYDTFPVTHPLLLKVWMSVFSFWPADVSLRLLGFFIGVGVTAAFWRFSTRHSATPPLLFFALFCLSPLIVRYIGTTRPYGLSALALILLLDQTLCFVRFGTRRHLLGAALWAFLAVHTHYLNVLALAAIALSALVAVRVINRPLRCLFPLLAGFGFALLSMLIYVPTLRFAATWSEAIRGARGDFSAPWTMIGWLLGASNHAFVPITIVVALGSLGVFGFRLANREPAEEEGEIVNIFCLSAAILSLLFMVGATVGAGAGTAPWHPIPFLAVVAVCLERGYSLLPRVARAPLLAGVAALMTASLAAAPEPLSRPMSTMREVADFCAQKTMPGDLIVLVPWAQGVSFGFYYRGQTSWATVPPLSDTSIVRFDLMQRLKNGPDPMPPLFARMERVLRSGHRVILVGEMVFPSGPPADWRDFDTRFFHWVVKHPRQTQTVAFSDAVGIEFESPPVNIFSGWEGK